MGQKITSHAKKWLISVLFIPVLLGQTVIAHSQNPAQILLKQKTQHRLQKMVNHSPAVTGLVVINLKKGQTDFAFNPDIVFPQASAIKIAVLMEVYKQAYAGKFSLSAKHTIKSENIVGGTGIIKNMNAPLQLTIQNICVLMISVSDNSATNALIDLVGMENVNNTMKSLGFDNTMLRRKMMDTKASAAGRENVSTPVDAANILKLLYNGKFINQDISSEIIDILKKPARRDSRLAVGLPDNIPIAFKPGELNGVSTEWALVLLPEQPYAIAVMESYKPNTEGQLMEKISRVLYCYYWRIGNATRYGTYANKKWK